MKLRMFGNSLRLRLSRGEVSRLAAGEAVEERTELLPASLTYRIELGAASVIEANFDGGVLRVIVPEVLGRQWASQDTVSIIGDVAGAEGARIKVLIEKDFRCLHGEETEGQEDTYPNPNVEDPVEVGIFAAAPRSGG
jgi:HSP20 family molecular chaperone IbpA